MNTDEQDTEEKKYIKKYSIHQKINTRMLGIEIFNQNIAVPYNAYLVCKLIYKEDVQSLQEIEEVVFEIQNNWENEYQEIVIERIHMFVSEQRIVLTFSLGFFQKDQAKKLPKIKEWIKYKIENHSNVLSPRMIIDNNSLKNIVVQIQQLESKMDKIEYQLKKNESIMVNSSKRTQEEVINIKNQITKKNEQTEIVHKIRIDKNNFNKIKTHPKVKSSPEITTHKNEKQKNNFYLVRGKKIKKIITRWELISPILKAKQLNSHSDEKINYKPRLSEYEKKIVYYFTEVKTSEKKQIIPKKKFLNWQAKIEFIDYLWKMFESEKKEELIIAQKVSCKNLIDELPMTIVAVEELSKSTTLLLFNYWIYCPHEILVKLKGYVVLAEYLDSILDDTKSVFMVS